MLLWLSFPICIFGGIVAVKNEVGAGQRFWDEIKSDSVISPMGAGILGVEGVAEVEIDTVMWGDSFAGSILMSLDEQLRRHGRSSIAVANDGCTPVIGLRRIYDGFGCSANLNRYIFDQILLSSSVENIVLIGNFSKFLGDNLNRSYRLGEEIVEPSDVFEVLKYMAKAINERGKKLILVGDPSSFSKKVPDYLIEQLGNDISLDDPILQVSKDKLVSAYGFVKYDLSNMLGAIYLDSLELFCQEKICNAVMDSGLPIVVDEADLCKEAADLQALAILRKVN